MPQAVNRDDWNLASMAVARQDIIDCRIVNALAFGYKNRLIVR